MTRPARVLVNAGGSNSGGGRTYVLAFVDELARGGPRGLDWEIIVRPDVAGWLPARLPAGVRIVEQPLASPAARIAWEQTVLLWKFRRARADVLVSAANFGPLLRRRRTILWARNALLFSPPAFTGRPYWRLMAQSALARRSVRASTVVLTATDHMAGLVAEKTSVRPVTLPFGPGLVRARRPGAQGATTFVHRTMWGPHKRLLDLLRAVRLLAESHPGAFKVHTACDPRTAFARQYTESAAERELLADPEVRGHVELTHFEPRAAEVLVGDAVVVPSTVESFCFPLAEAVSLGMPVVAADTPFAREVCGPGAIYARPGDPRSLADGMRRVLDGASPPAAPADVRERLSWPRHVDGLAAICREVAGVDPPTP